MVVKIYVSGISGNKEVKKRQQRVLMILDSKNITYEVIDITEPGKEHEKDFMQNNAKSSGGTVSDPNPRSPLPPQVFNDEEYCGDYDQFDLANEVDTLEQFLKVEVPPEDPPQPEETKAVNGDIDGDKSKESKEPSQERDNVDAEKSDEKVQADQKEGSPVKEEPETKEGSPEKEKTSREATPKDGEEPKEASPEREAEHPKEESPAKDAIEKEESPAKEVIEKEESPAKEAELETKPASKENSPEKETVNENGTVSSRGQSEEKEHAEGDTDIKKDNPSEALIQSEQAAAAE